MALPAGIRVAAELRVTIECRPVVSVTTYPRPAPPRIRPPRELVIRYVHGIAAGRRGTFKADDVIQPDKPGRPRRRSPAGRLSVAARGKTG